MVWSEQARVTIRPDEVGRPFMTGTESFCISIRGRLYCDRVRQNSYWSFHYYDKVHNSEFPDQEGPLRELQDNSHYLAHEASYPGSAVYCHENRILILTPHSTIDCDDTSSPVPLLPEVYLQGYTLFVKIKDRPGFVKMVSTNGLKKPLTILHAPPTATVQLERIKTMGYKT